MGRIIGILLFISFLSCSELRFDNELPLPIVRMTEVSDIDSSGVTLKAFVHHLGSGNIIRSSFNWYPKYKFYVLEEDRFLIDVKLRNQTELSIRIDRDLMPGVEYEGRFIVELENEKIYSPPISFMSKGALFNPIQIKKKFNAPDLSSRALAFAGLGKVFIVNSYDIFVYQEEQDSWELRPVLIRDRLKTGFQSANNSIFGYDPPHNLLWRLDDFDSGTVKLGTFSPSEFAPKFSFVINDICYVNTVDWKLSSFSVDNFEGVNVASKLPFPKNAYEYYAFGVKDKGYVFFSNPEVVSSGPFQSHQFWQFDPNSSSWQQMPDFPGTGKDYFSISTDEEQYIYVGMGTNGRMSPYYFDSAIKEGDIWRYDTVANKWEFIGWSPEDSHFFPFKNSVEKNGKIYFITSQSVNVRVVCINQNKIQPF